MNRLTVLGGATALFTLVTLAPGLTAQGGKAAAPAQG